MVRGGSSLIYYNIWRCTRMITIVCCIVRQLREFHTDPIGKNSFIFSSPGALWCGPTPNLTQHYYMSASEWCQPETQQHKTIHFFEEYLYIFNLVYSPLASCMSNWPIPGSMRVGLSCSPVEQHFPHHGAQVGRCTQVHITGPGDSWKRGFRLCLTSSLAGPQVLMVEGGRGGSR